MHQTANLHNTEKFSILQSLTLFFVCCCVQAMSLPFSPKDNSEKFLPSFLVLSKLGKIAREAEQDSHFQGMSTPDLTASL